MTWIYQKALERAEQFHIPGVTYNLTLGVVKKVIPAVASTNAIIAAACSLEAIKVITKFAPVLSNYMMYNGRMDVNADVIYNERNPECLVCASVTREIRIGRNEFFSDFLSKLDEMFMIKDPSIINEKSQQVYQGKGVFANTYKDLPNKLIAYNDY